MADSGVGGEAPLAAVIGHPVAHSLSPAIFGSIARRLRQPLDYRRIDVAPGELAGFVRACRGVALFTGWNITIPHKAEVSRLCDELTPEARATGAVNVVQFLRAPSRLRGFNTDIFGIERTLAEQRFRSRGRRVLILGSGGAARAVSFALGRGGAADVWIANRTVARARAVARGMSRLFPGTSFHAVGLSEVGGTGTFDLVVNATPLGMKGFPAHRIFSDRWSGGSRQPLAFDLVYRPERTGFLDAAARAGFRTVGGLDMLLWQAIATWEVWFGRLGPARASRLKRALRSELRTAL